MFMKLEEEPQMGERRDITFFLKMQAKSHLRPTSE